MSGEVGQPAGLRLLTRGDVSHALSAIDPLDTIEATLRADAQGLAVLPAEAYLTWRNSKEAYCRSLAMPAGLFDTEPPALGVKVINAAVSNPEIGLPRAAGFSALFDFETAQPILLAEGALISALRTGCYTIASIRTLGPQIFDRVAILGCGNLAEVHLQLIRRYLPNVLNLDLYDVHADRAKAVARQWERIDSHTATLHDDPRSAVAEAPVLITLTTSDRPYLERSWLPDQLFVAHVSLDDLQRQVFVEADWVYVDNRELVRDNPRRILGRLVQDGVISFDHEPGRPSLTGTLGQVLAGLAPAPEPGVGHVISNPFGMAILDVALLRAVHQVAVRDNLGFHFDLTSHHPGAQAAVDNVRPA